MRDIDSSANTYRHNNFTVEQLYAMLDKIPVCIGVVNERGESIYCNDYTVQLYGVADKRKFNEEFYQLTPETQPDGKNSKLAFGEHVLYALEAGERHFSWLDIKRSGEELPLYISFYSLNLANDNGDNLLVYTMQDLRPQLAGDDEEFSFDEYYYRRVTYKALFNTVAELTDEWFWIYDVNVSTIQFFGKGREILGLSATPQPFPDYVVNSGMVHPDDLDAFLKFNSNLKTGVVDPVEVRFVQPNGVARYYRIIYKTIYNKNNDPVFSIGKTYDIDKQKKLEVLSKTDLLTNCLNKVTTENIVAETINSHPNSNHALFLIDVDDFKSVNDVLGHYFGDITLSDIAKNLHSNFRGDDIIGRIGGDEFLVFVKDVSDEKIIERKARSIAEAFKNSYSGENKDYKVSGSIGVALYPSHADTYEGLYKCADKALYSSKMAGKDRYTIYSGEIADSETKKLTAVDNANKPLNAYFDSDITALVFDLMYQSVDIKKSMNTVIRLFGTHFNVDRCYVAQTFDLGQSFSITYEWYASKQLELRNSFQNIPANQLKSFFNGLEENNIMYSNYLENDEDTCSSLPGFNSSNSYLLAQTRGKGFTRLVFGIEDSNKYRVWSEKEINTVQYVLKLISIFIASNKSPLA